MTDSKQAKNKLAYYRKYFYFQVHFKRIFFSQIYFIDLSLHNIKVTITIHLPTILLLILHFKTDSSTGHKRILLYC